MEDPDQTILSDLGLHCLSRYVWQATIQNFQIFTIPLKDGFRHIVITSIEAKNCLSSSAFLLRVCNL